MGNFLEVSVTLWKKEEWTLRISSDTTTIDRNFPQRTDPEDFTYHQENISLATP
jgi:hypothetical protein